MRRARPPDALHEAGRTPILCGRTARGGLELQVADGTIAVPGPVQTDSARIAAPVDLVLLAVKSTQVDAAAPWLAALCRADTVVCVLQNGVEQEAAVGRHARGKVLPAVVWFPAQAQPDGRVWLRGQAHFTLPDVPAARVVLDAFAGTRCVVDLAEDFATTAWRKLLQNAVAGLMVLTGRRSGMFARGDVSRLALAYLRECLAVARAEGAALGEDAPQEIFNGFGPTRSTWERRPRGRSSPPRATAPAELSRVA